MTVTALAVAIAAAKVLDGGNVNSGSAPSNYQPSAAIASDDGTTGAIAFLFAVAGVNLSNADPGD
jgi:hypothetical protein